MKPSSAAVRPHLPVQAYRSGAPPPSTPSVPPANSKLPALERRHAEAVAGAVCFAATADRDAFATKEDLGHFASKAGLAALVTGFTDRRYAVVLGAAVANGLIAAGIEALFRSSPKPDYGAPLDRSPRHIRALPDPFRRFRARENGSRDFRFRPGRLANPPALSLGRFMTTRPAARKKRASRHVPIPSPSRPPAPMTPDSRSSAVNVRAVGGLIPTLDMNAGVQLHSRP